MAVLLRARSEEFLLCLEQKRYFDAHEVLEVLWFPRRFEKSSAVYLLRGLINAAVSFELLKRGRKEASARVWKNYLKYRPLLEEIASDERDHFNMMIEKIEKIKVHGV